jgi:DNA-binding response OmpR family regulator
MLRVLLFYPDGRDCNGIRNTILPGTCEAELTHVRNMEGFLAAIAEWHFDAILLDYSPLSNQIAEILETARRRRPVTPTIALCAPDAEFDGRLALREGAADYVPGDQLVRLTSTIRRAVANIESHAHA